MARSIRAAQNPTDSWSRRLKLCSRTKLQSCNIRQRRLKGKTTHGMRRCRSWKMTSRSARSTKTRTSVVVVRPSATCNEESLSAERHQTAARGEIPNPCNPRSVSAIRMHPTQGINPPTATALSLDREPGPAHMTSTVTS